MAHEVDILIVGAGHAGLLLAGALGRAGFGVAIVEPVPLGAIAEASPDGRTLALMRSSRTAMERLGAWTSVEPVATPVLGAEVVDAASGGRVAYRRDAPDEPPFAYGVVNTELRRALLHWALAGCGARALLPGRVRALRRGRRAVEAVLEGGASVTAALVVGADGRGSTIRRLAGIALDQWTYPQTAVTFVVAHDAPHDGLVRERLRPQGPLALLPVGPRHSGVTWVEPHAEAQRILAMEPAERATRLDREIRHALGTLAIVGPSRGWPLGAQHARRYVAPRVALVGDAAHGVHPIHAQGFNMGVADVAALVDALSGTGIGRSDPGDAGVLLAYERRRRGANTRTIWLTDGLNRLFSNDLPGLRTLRGAGLRLLDRIAPLRALAVEMGSGG
jgi:2-octaprenyl-6-methoxyphenol hydroxylase